MTSRDARISYGKGSITINNHKGEISSTSSPNEWAGSLTAGRHRNNNSGVAGPSVKSGAVIISLYRGELRSNFAGNTGVTLVTPSNKPDYIENIFANYLRQTYEPKELIIVLNNNAMNLDEWNSRASQYPNVRVFQLDESKTLGECMNFAAEQSMFGFIAMVDDDDYYAHAYLQRVMPVFNQVNADVIGKGSHYVYFEASHTLAIVHPDRQNQFNHAVAGATLVIKKEVLNRIRFEHINDGPDSLFTQACLHNGIPIYSTDRADFVYLRRPNFQSHTYQIEDAEYLKACQVIGQTEDYISQISS